MKKQAIDYDITAITTKNYIYISLLPLTSSAQVHSRLLSKQHLLSVPSVLGWHMLI